MRAFNMRHLGFHSASRTAGHLVNRHALKKTECQFAGKCFSNAFRLANINKLIQIQQHMRESFERLRFEEHQAQRAFLISRLS